MSKLSGFFKNVVSEMRKVSWPKRKELTALYDCRSFNCRLHGDILRNYRSWHFAIDGMVSCVVR